MKTLRDEDIHAFVDGELDEGRRAELEARLAEHPEEAARARSYRQLNDALRAHYEPMLDEAVPEHLLVRQTSWRAHARTFARAAAVLAIGVAIGWVTRGYAPLPAAASIANLPKQAAIAHAVYAPEVRHPVEVGADEEEHLVRWLSKRLGTELKCPSLAAYGFTLVGGRLLSGPDGPVAHFMFQDGKGTRLTLYVSGERKGTAETSFRYAQEDRVSVFYWVEGKFGYALSGELGREQMLGIANAVYQQLHS
jgi:anti-sigma factor RsiW